MMPLVSTYCISMPERASVLVIGTACLRSLLLLIPVLMACCMQFSAAVIDGSGSSSWTCSSICFSRSGCVCQHVFRLLREASSASGRCMACGGLGVVLTGQVMHCSMHNLRHVRGCAARAEGSPGSFSARRMAGRRVQTSKRCHDAFTRFPGSAANTFAHRMPSIDRVSMCTRSPLHDSEYCTAASSSTAHCACSPRPVGGV